MNTRVVLIGPSSTVEAAIIAKEGGLLVYPTDTVYGVGCNPFNAEAVEKLFGAKARVNKPVPVLCDSIRSARMIVSMSPTAKGLAEEFWPGGLTIVMPTVRKFPYSLDQGSGEVGVRIPARTDCVKLIKQCGGFLVGTSANVSGSPPCRTAAEALNELGGKVDIILDGGRLEGKESTVVRVRGESVEVLRHGAVKI